MSRHPYQSLPPTAFWKRAVASRPLADIDPVVDFRLTISHEMKVSTAGSCFAQHIARYLKKSGFCYFVAEQAHALVPPAVSERNNYGLFSARYGNIYTARQLLQLVRRCLKRFAPIDDVWTDKNGATVDPFRPTTQPGGYINAEEMKADRQQHLAAVRRMFEMLDVFVFTLGLTECWISRRDGAAYPLCPGVDGGIFSNAEYQFYNQTVADVYCDLNEFMDLLHELNPRAQVILTVSPVPLAATAVHNAHVLPATTYSKSVLRVAAGMLETERSNVHYFPSFEIVTSAASRGMYFAEDLRNVTEAGIQHVMRVFLKHATVATPVDIFENDVPSDKLEGFQKAAAQLVEVICDEVKVEQ